MMEPPVISDQEIMGGTPCFAGTRIPLAALFDNLESGATVEQFVNWFPGVTMEQVRAAMDHAAARAVTGKLNEVYCSQSSQSRQSEPG
jgi:uncharacterized protein (DUF433 family)